MHYKLKYLLSFKILTANVVIINKTFKLLKKVIKYKLSVTVICDYFEEITK